MAELKPCPFCGRIPTVEDCGDNRFFVRCKCGIAQDKLYGQRCDAVKRWNTRKPADAVGVSQPNLQQTCNKVATDCISRQGAIDALVDELAHRPDGYWDSGLNRYDVEVVLSQQPSVDAAEVVRCKDCKYWDIFDIHSTICPDNKRCKGIIGKMYTGPDYYCAYGERKDD